MIDSFFKCGFVLVFCLLAYVAYDIATAPPVTQPVLIGKSIIHAETKLNSLKLKFSDGTNATIMSSRNLTISYSVDEEANK